jgi:hypothetical protein
MATTNVEQPHESPSPGDGAGQAAVERAQEVTGEVRRQAGNVAQDMKSQTQHLLERTKEEVSKEASSRAGQFASTMHEVANELRMMADADEPGRLQGFVRGAADRADNMASTIDDRGFEGVVDDVKGMVRRRPGIVLIAAAATGFLVGRLVREAGQVAGNGNGSARTSIGQSERTPGDVVDLTGQSGAGGPASAIDPLASLSEGRHG